VNFNTIQKELFDLTVFVSKTDVQKEANLLIGANKDYHWAIAGVALQSGRLTDFIRGKR